MEEFDLSSASCFERHYTLFNEDGSDYTGPLYVDEWGVLLLEGNPYEYVDETLYGKIEISVQQPISDRIFSLPPLTGYVHIISSGDVTDPDDNSSCDDGFYWDDYTSTCMPNDDDDDVVIDPVSSFNLVWSADEIMCPAGQLEDMSHDWLRDEDISTVFEVSCDANYQSSIVFYFTEAIPLQTVGIKLDPAYAALDGGYGTITIGTNGEDDQYCQVSSLDGFHMCSYWANTITISAICIGTDASGQPANGLRIAEIGFFPYAEAGAFGYIENV
jgi:hypothetical protein